MGSAFHFSNRFLDQKRLDREQCLESWSIVSVENQIIGPKFQAFLHAQLHESASTFPDNKTDGCLDLCNEFKVNNTLHIEQNDGHVFIFDIDM
jgi:hypothetical protein